MATKRGGNEKGRLLELRERPSTSAATINSIKTHKQDPIFKRETAYVERNVLQTDTIQGIALIYNTSVAEIKRLNQLQTDIELHARRVIKVPSRGILINLEPEPQKIPSLTENNGNLTIDQFNELSIEENEIEDEMSTQSVQYFNDKDAILTEIRAKVDHVASNSPILNGNNSSDDIHYLETRRKDELNLKWWHVLFPCLSFIIIFPILIFIFQEHLTHLGHHHLTETHQESTVMTVGYANNVQEQEIVVPEVINTEKYLQTTSHS